MKNPCEVLYFVDLETTVDGGPDHNNPEAHWKNNKVLLCGYAVGGNPIHVHSTVDVLAQCIQNGIEAGFEPTIVAHNAKFDLKYLMRDAPFVEWHKVSVWDTMTWQYLYSGHVSKFESLTDALDGWGIKYNKQLDLGDLLARGIKMQDIPTNELSEYLKEDVTYLRQLYFGQLTTKYTPFMDYILPLCEMELNGLPIDLDKATADSYDLIKDTTSIFDTFQAWLIQNCQWQDGSPLVPEDFSEMMGTKSKTIKPMSNRTISFILTGWPAQLKITEKWRVQYQYGCSHIYDLQTAQDFLKVYPDPPNQQGYPMSEDDLLNMVKEFGPHKMVDLVLDYRTKNKLAGTYLLPFTHTAKVQGCIYPKLNTTVTGTGRLSSSAPNGQNIPPPARACIIPDNDEDELAEIDFSQLEMVACATLSADPQMIIDINTGEDLHFNTGRSVMGWKSPADMTDADRKIVKGVNFGVLYGGKATGLSKQTGVDKGLVQDLINNFYRRYPQVAVWQEQMKDYVNDYKEAHDIRRGEQRHATTYTLPISNRKFTFVETEAPDWLRQRTGKTWTFSPQQIANYPIQGFAGGDLVMYALYWLWVVVRNTPEYADKVKFRMTVHDSILLQIRKGLPLTKLVEAMCSYTGQRYNLPVPLHCDIKTGNQWQ